MATARLFGLALFLLACMTGAGHAQTWPSRPVRVIVPITTGSAIDIVARATSQQLARSRKRSDWSPNEQRAEDHGRKKRVTGWPAACVCRELHPR